MSAKTNVSDPKKLDKARKLSKLKEAQEIKDFRQLCENPAFRAYLWRLIDMRCRVYDNAFTGNNTTFHNTGKQEIGLGILRDIRQLSPATEALMVKESQQREEQYA